MKIYQQALTLPAQRRGFHLITSAIVRGMPAIQQIRAGLCQVFIQHTSASLTINENADPTVRKDFETYFNKMAPENDPDYLHDDEGSDDMPAHLKAALLGSSVLIPITDGRLALGIWQGIYLCEHRNQGIRLIFWGQSDLSIDFSESKGLRSASGVLPASYSRMPSCSISVKKYCPSLSILFTKSMSWVMTVTGVL